MSQEENKIRMKVSASEAAREISQIEHKTCQRGLERYWTTYQDNTGKDQATAQSICWLSCWAKTGRGSRKALTQAQHAFDDIFDQPHDWLTARLPQEDAKRLRYKNRRELVKRREQDFTDCLKRNSPKSQ